MSYTIYIKNRKWKRVEDLEEAKNVTWNLSPMFREGLRQPEGIRWLHHKKAKKTIKKLEQCLLDMIKNPEKYQEMEPENRWGTYQYAVEVIQTMLQWAIKHPKAYFYIS